MVGRMIRNENGITVRELKEFVKNLQETDDNGEPFEVWFETGDNLSSVCTEVGMLNSGDIIIGRIGG